MLKQWVALFWILVCDLPTLIVVIHHFHHYHDNFYQSIQNPSPYDFDYRYWQQFNSQWCIFLEPALLIVLSSLHKRFFWNYTLKTLLDTGSQLARDRLVTGSLTGRRSLIYYEPTLTVFQTNLCRKKLRTNWGFQCIKN